MYFFRTSALTTKGYTLGESTAQKSNAAMALRGKEIQLRISKSIDTHGKPAYVVEQLNAEPLPHSFGGAYSRYSLAIDHFDAAPDFMHAIEDQLPETHIIIDLRKNTLCNTLLTTQAGDDLLRYPRCSDMVVAKSRQIRIFAPFVIDNTLPTCHRGSYIGCLSYTLRRAGDGAQWEGEAVHMHSAWEPAMLDHHIENISAAMKEYFIFHSMAALSNSSRMRALVKLQKVFTDASFPELYQAPGWKATVGEAAVRRYLEVTPLELSI